MAAEPYLRRFAKQLALLFAAISLLPFIFGLLGAPSGATYLGFQLNTDDHMVYAAWMRQAMDGHFLFDNRFAVESQPGLTLHLLFLVMGWVAKVFGIALTCALAKAAFTYWFVILLGRLIERMTDNVFTGRLALGLAMVGSGLGFLLWHNFGLTLAKPETKWADPLTRGYLPIDVWQPEAFVVPSLLTNALFMASLCLIAGIFLNVLRARESSSAVLPGLACFGLLMNIHSYDVLLVALVLVAFAVVCGFNRQLEAAWVKRVALMGLGAVPFALWFVYVLRNDAVFQARAATPTYAPTSQQVLIGLVLLLVPALAGWATREKPMRVRLGALGLLGLLALGWVLSGSPDGYWLTALLWVVGYALMITLAVMVRSDRAEVNLIQCWALVGIIAPYFPALFQRKLAMGLAIPWSVLAAFGLAVILVNRERSARNLLTVFVVLVFSATGLRWLFRERLLAQTNVSNTTVHSVYVSDDVQRILGVLNETTGRQVVIAMPGVSNPQSEKDSFLSPYVPDFNPIISGLTGAYTYAGHWSETPNYQEKRMEAMHIFMKATSDAERASILNASGATYLVAPVPEAFPSLSSSLADVTSLGEAVTDGAQFRLIKLRR